MSTGDGSEPADDAAIERAPDPLGNLVAAHLQRVEAVLLARVLATTLAGALPSSMVRIEWRRSFGEWLRRKPGAVVGVSITGGEVTLTFRAPEVGVTEATIGHTVRGVVLSTERVPVSEWLTALGALLDQVARDDEATRLALENVLRS